MVADDSERSRAMPQTPLVRLLLDSSPESLTLVRGALGALGDLLSIDPELLDDMKTAISEACNNVVVHAYEVGTGPLEVDLRLGTDAMVAAVRDEGRGIPEMADPDEGVHGVGVPLIKALADEVVFASDADAGTEVLMEFA